MLDDSMVDGRWQMADGRWQMYYLGNLGLWVMVDDGMADGRWQMGYGGMYFERKSTGQIVRGYSSS